MLDQEKVREDAKRIMDSFLEELGDVELEEGFNLTSEECFREEGEGFEGDDDFRERFLSNAAKVKGNYILADKGAWVE